MIMNPLHNIDTDELSEKMAAAFDREAEVSAVWLVKGISFGIALVLHDEVTEKYYVPYYNDGAGDMCCQTEVEALKGADRQFHELRVKKELTAEDRSLLESYIEDMENYSREIAESHAHYGTGVTQGDLLDMDKNYCPCGQCNIDGREEDEANDIINAIDLTNPNCYMVYDDFPVVV